MTTETQGKLSQEALTKNAGLINAAHRAIVGAGKTQLEKAVEAGTMLKACKDSVGHGEWSKWLHDNCREISEETARLYMRLADPENAPKLEQAAKQNGNAVADLSVRGAAKLISAKRTEEQKAATAAKKAETEQLKAVIKLSGMDVDDVLRLLTASFDDDFLDTLHDELGKQLEKSAPKEEVKAPAISTATRPSSQSLCP